MSVIDLLDQLEGLIANGRRIVFTPSVMVNEDEALDLVDRARMELPDEIKQAHWTVQEQQRLMAEAEDAARRLADGAREQAEAVVAAARQEADRLLAEASARAETMVSEAEVVRAAQARAEAMLRDARAAAARIREEADAYVRDVMGRLEANLARMTETVRAGIESLAPQAESASPV